jgi:hypothetical protein
MEKSGERVPVVGGECWLCCLALQDGELVPQHQDLNLPLTLAHRQQAYQGERVGDGEVGVPEPPDEPPGL